MSGLIVVHRARLLPRLALVGVVMTVSLAVTGAIAWFAVLGVDDVQVGGRGGATRGAEASVVDPIAVPAGWPAVLAPPEGATVVSSVASGAGTAEEELVVVVEVPGAGPVVADALRAQLTAAGLTVSTDAVGPDGVGSVAAAGAGWDATVSVSPTPARPGVTTVSWVLRRGAR